MSVLARITIRVPSSKMLFQRNFDEASDKSPVGAHLRAALMAIVFAALCAVFVVGFSRAEYWAARSLLEQGVAAAGTVDRVQVQIQDTVGPRKYRITTVEYRFVAANGQRHRGTSVTKTRTPPLVARGDTIEVRYDGARPDTNAWHTALKITIASVYGGVFAALMLLPCVAFMLYRYGQWLSGRRQIGRVPASA